MKNRFIEHLHKGFNTPVSLIKLWIYKYINDDILDINKIIKGYANEVYSIKTCKGKNIIIKINHYGGAYFNQEVWAMEQARANGVPVAHVYYYGTEKLGNCDKNIIIQDKVQGVSLDELWGKLSKREIEKVLFKVGELLSKVHLTRTKGFYGKNIDGSWHHTSWDELINLTIKNRKKDIPYYKTLGLTSKEIKIIMKSLDIMKFNEMFKLPVLCHGDFVTEHIIINDDNDINGIIDFGSFQGWAPIKDYAVINFLNPYIDLNLVLKGYGSKRFENFEFYLLISKLEYLLPLIQIYDNIGDMEQFEYSKRQLFETIDILKKYPNFSHKILIYDS